MLTLIKRQGNMNIRMICRSFSTEATTENEFKFFTEQEMGKNLEINNYGISLYMYLAKEYEGILRLNSEFMKLTEDINDSNQGEF